MNINYPLFNIDAEECDEFFFPEMFRYSLVFFDNKNESVFKKYFQNKRYVDRDGNLYIAIKLIERSSQFRKALFLQRKYSIVFQDLGEKISFEEVKVCYIKCINGFKNEEAKLDTYNFANKCMNLEELL